MRAEKEIPPLVRLLKAWIGKGYTADEIASCAGILRREVKRVECGHEAFIDVVGTGGSRSKTFNVSTAAAFVASGAGLPVAKHGNRAASSKTGSADVLSQLGVGLAAGASKAARCLDLHGICFMFAPYFHNLTKELAFARRQIGRPTIFNLLGPIANPAGAPYQLIGVWDEAIKESYANAISSLGTQKTWLVRGADGLDEITLSGPTLITEVTESGVEHFEVSPSDFGIKERPVEGLKTDSPEESAAVVLRVLEGRDGGAARDLVLINAAGALFVAGVVTNLKDGYRLASESLESGAANGKLKALVKETRE